jgi:hypothetical protein
MKMNNTSDPAIDPHRPEGPPRSARRARLWRPKATAPRPAGALGLPGLIQDFALSKPANPRSRRWQLLRALARESTAADPEHCGCGHDCADCTRSPRDHDPAPQARNPE